MRVLLSTYGSRGDVDPMVGLALRLRALGGEVRVCAPRTRTARKGWPRSACRWCPTPTTESLSGAVRTTLSPETRARGTAVAGTIRTGGATVAATLLLDRS
jgi:hypothetical protein